MGDGVCHLCFESSLQMKYNFQQNLEYSEIQDFVEIFCQFVFNDSTCTFGEICLKCWQTLDQFSQFCDKIRGIHQNLIEVSCTTSTNKYEDHSDIATEVLEDEIEEHIPMEEIDEKEVTMLAIESDLGDEGDGFVRRATLTPQIIRKLEEQLKFEPKIVEVSDMNFDRMSRFLAMECNMCDENFESIDECHEHYLQNHGRSAYWNCCNLLLETPYDILDHIRYHESIDVFKCAACSKCFLTSNKLKYHIRRSHLPAGGSFDCKICDKECRNLRLLLNHQKCHIRIECPHCRKHVSAASYEHHIRSTHATQFPTKKRKASNKKNAANKKLRNDEIKTSGSSKMPKKPEPPKFMINIKPNDHGMFECDICRMPFKQVSLVFSHRNKVHV